jgi:hypothetical protein
MMSMVSHEHSFVSNKYNYVSTSKTFYSKQEKVMLPRFLIIAPWCLGFRMVSKAKGDFILKATGLNYQGFKTLLGILGMSQ